MYVFYGTLSHYYEIDFLKGRTNLHHHSEWEECLLGFQVWISLIKQSSCTVFSFCHLFVFLALILRSFYFSYWLTYYSFVISGKLRLPVCSLFTLFATDFDVQKRYFWTRMSVLFFFMISLNKSSPNLSSSLCWLHLLLLIFHLCGILIYGMQLVCQWIFILK